MITEDYVSFETAKLFKDKGFDAECDYLYVNGKLVRAQGCACNWNNGETIFADYKNECSAPTLQMAMKWLREVHGLFIGIDYVNIAGLGFTYQTTILRKGEDYSYCLHKKHYEEACEAAIKYCLEKLI